MTTLHYPLPHTLHRPIAGGCQCPYCTDHPHNIPQWDTLAVDTSDPSRTWIVHYPELSHRRNQRRAMHYLATGSVI